MKKTIFALMCVGLLCAASFESQCKPPPDPVAQEAATIAFEAPLNVIAITPVAIDYTILVEQPTVVSPADVLVFTYNNAAPEALTPPPNNKALEPMFKVDLCSRLSSSNYLNLSTCNGSQNYPAPNI